MASGLKPVGAAPVEQGPRLRPAEVDSSPLDWVTMYGSGANSILMGAADYGLEKLMGMDRGPGKQIFNYDRVPRNADERVAYEAGRQTAINIAALIPSFKAANVGMTAAEKIADPTVTELIRRSLLDGIRSSPKAAAILEELAAAGSGAGAETAKEIGAGPVGQTVGGIVGGLAASGSLSPTVWMYKGGKAAATHLLSWLSPSGMANRSKEAVAELLAKNLDDVSLANLAQSNKLFEESGISSRPTTAEASKAPSLLKLQADLEAKKAGAEFNAVVRRKEDIQTDLLENNKWRPEMTGIEPKVVYDDVTRAVETENLSRKQELDVLGMSRRQLAERLPNTNRVATGDALRDRVTQLRDTETSKFAQRANDIGLNDQDVGFDISELQTRLKSAFFNEKSRLVDEDLPDAVRKILSLKPTKGVLVDKNGQPLKEDNVVPFQDLETINRNLGEDWKTARATGDHRRMRQLAMAKKLVEDYWAAITPIGGKPDLIPNWQKFRADYKTDVIDRFDKGAAYKVVGQNMRGEYRTSSERVADLFIGSESDAIKFKAVFGNDPEAMSAMRSTILDKVRNMRAIVGHDGINHKALQSWVNSQRWLNEFPSVKQELLDVAASESAIGSRMAAIKDRGKIAGKAALQMRLGGPPDEFIGKALRNEDIARHVARIAKDAGHEEALRSTMWQGAYKELGYSPDRPDIPVDPAALREYMTSHAKTMKIMMGDEHFSNLEKLLKGLEIISPIPAPKGAAEAIGPVQKLEQLTGTSIPGVESRLMALKTRRIGEGWALTAGASRWFNKLAKGQQDKLVEQALMDPVLAQELAGWVRVPELSIAQGKRLNGWLLSFGVQSPVKQMQERKAQ